MTSFFAGCLFVIGSYVAYPHIRAYFSKLYMKKYNELVQLVAEEVASKLIKEKRSTKKDSV